MVRGGKLDGPDGTSRQSLVLARNTLQLQDCKGEHGRTRLGGPVQALGTVIAQHPEAVEDALRRASKWLRFA